MVAARKEAVREQRNGERWEALDWESGRTEEGIGAREGSKGRLCFSQSFLSAKAGP